MNVKYGSDLKLSIATGKSRHESRWKNIDLSWPELVDKLSCTTRTFENVNDYASMKKDKQDTIKDVGGFVGGELKDGKRKNGFVASRSLVTLDIDYGSPDLWDDIEVFTEYAMICYSTHKHTPSKPRLRLIIPLDRKVGPEEYEAVARKLAAEIGMDYFDDTTYQPSRLMFWPSTPKDGEFFFKFLDQPILNVDKVLNAYPDWRDTSYWPESTRMSTIRKKSADKQGDPLAKDGLIGAFCRTYTIQDAISKFIPDEYTECGNGRYTYAKGSTAGGLVIYGDKFAYSNHGTDPTGQQLCNAFDLVRIHKFGQLDDEAKANTPVNKLPSWKAMMDFIAKDEDVKSTIIKEGIDSAQNDFDEDEDVNNDDEWLKKLTVNKQGIVEATLNNIILICKNDPNLNKLGSYDIFRNRIEPNKNLPWARHSDVWDDDDDIGLRVYLERTYKIDAKAKVEDAAGRVFMDYARHSVKEYLDSLEWDGIPRLDTLIIDTLGADDTPYTREVTRKTLVAGVKRIYHPGVEFQQCLVLCGEQGCGKSQLARELGRKWFSDQPGSLATDGKEKYERLDGVWVMEWAENNMARKAEKEAVRAFISMRVARYRQAYGRRISERPIQNITIVTTNDREFLSEFERRHWVIDVFNKKPKINKKIKDLGDAFFDQIWAEAKYYYTQGEDIYTLSDEATEEFMQVQQAHIYEDEWEGQILEFLAKKIPTNWYSLTLEGQISYMQGDVESDVELVERDKVCSAEIANILFPHERKDVWRIKKILDKLPGWTYSSKTSKYGYLGSRRGFLKTVAK